MKLASPGYDLLAISQNLSMVPWMKGRHRAHSQLGGQCSRAFDDEQCKRGVIISINGVVCSERYCFDIDSVPGLGILFLAIGDSCHAQHIRYGQNSPRNQRCLSTADNLRRLPDPFRWS